tara:strand:- start:31 stop:498 length:468 start_codon:yes stop_codon:yes gene_type:complete
MGIIGFLLLILGLGGVYSLKKKKKVYLKYSDISGMSIDKNRTLVGKKSKYRDMGSAGDSTFNGATITSVGYMGNTRQLSGDELSSDQIERWLAAGERPKYRSPVNEGQDFINAINEIIESWSDGGDFVVELVYRPGQGARTEEKALPLPKVLSDA